MTVEIGEVYENPRCGERVVVRTPAARTAGERTVLDVYAVPGGAVSGAHVHPISTERFTLVRGQIAFMISGRKVVLDRCGQSILIQPGIIHRWWNCGGDQSFHICEIGRNAERFEEHVLRQMFGLAQDGRTGPEGMPGLLQMALTTLEYGDVVRYTDPPPAVQRVLFTVLRPIARAIGLRGCYPQYLDRRPTETADLEPLPAEVATHHAP